MAGFKTILQIQSLQEEIDRLGFRWCYSKYGRASGREWGEEVALVPKDDESLPVYSRDTEIFTGTIDELEKWIEGVKWARDYDSYLGVSTASKRQRKEQDHRNQRLLEKIAKAGTDKNPE